MDVAVQTNRRLPARLPVRQLGQAATVAAIGAAIALAAVLGATAGDYPIATAVMRASAVGAPLVAARYSARQPRLARFSRLLAAIGAASLVVALVETGDPVLYSLGRVAGWAVELLLVVMLLTFPSGTFEAAADRRLARAMAVVTGVLFLPTAVLAEHYPVPSPYASCVHDCPRNAFFLLGHEPGFVHPLFIGLGSVLVLAIMLAVVVRLQHRLAAASTLGRQILLPVVAIGMARAALLGVAIVARELGGDAGVIRVSAWLIGIATPLIAVAFLVGLARSRLFSEHALFRLAACVRSGPDVAALQRAFADAFDDRHVEVLFPRDGDGDGWMDARGKPVVPPNGNRAVHVVRGRDGAPMAGLLCDAALADRPALLDAGTSIAAVALENLRLEAEAETAAHELRRSRARIAATADRERRRIERDLHDGAQQRLVALRIELALVENLVGTDPDACVARIRELELSVDEALEDLRSLAHGVRPPLLADRGLGEALRAAGAHSPIPVQLHVGHVGRYAPEAESAVYFCVLEALQNVAKHARGARRAVVRLDVIAGELRFEVIDDGEGAPYGAITEGAGLTNMRDRVAAVGGHVRIISRPGIGTEVRGHVPVA